jgi:hypothetical protein
MHAPIEQEIQQSTDQQDHHGANQFRASIAAVHGVHARRMNLP